MARRAKADSDATAVAVQVAAQALFAADGYADVGLEQIAAAAGVTRGAVYHHFASKRGLFTAVLTQAHAEVGESVVAAADRARAARDDPWDGVVAGCRTFLEASAAPAVCRILLLDGPAVVGWQTWRDQDAAASGHHLDDALAELASLGLLATVSVPATGALLSGAMNEAALWVAAHPESGRRDALEEAWSALHLLLAGLRPAA